MKKVQLPTDELPTPTVQTFKFGNIILTAGGTDYVEFEIGTIDYSDRINGNWEPKKTSFFIHKSDLISLSQYAGDVSKQMEIK